MAFSLCSPPDSLVQHILVFLASLGREPETTMVAGKQKTSNVIILKLKNKVSRFMREKNIGKWNNPILYNNLQYLYSIFLKLVQ